MSEPDREFTVEEALEALQEFVNRGQRAQHVADVITARSTLAVWRCTCGYLAPTAKALLTHHEQQHERI